jgi:aminoacylase
MVPFVKSTAFKNLNVGFGLDEGGASPTEPFLVFYGERALWRKT